MDDKNVFFREMTIRICSSLRIKTALSTMSHTALTDNEI